MIHYDQCPVCTGKNIKPAFSAKDYTVTQESFDVWICNSCSSGFTQNVPAKESIGKYYQSAAYVSHSDTKEGLVNRLYHSVRSITLSGKRKLVSSETGLNKGAILDIGCGTGAFLSGMKNAGWSATGLEPDETARNKARELYQLEPRSSDELFQLPAASFDAITMWHVLEHVHQLDQYLDRIHLLLKERGVLFIAVPNLQSYDAAHYKECWAAYDVPRHLYHFSANGMEQLLHRHGLKLKKIKPMWFDSFYVSMLSEQYLNGKGNIIKACCIGFLSNLKAMFNRRKCSSLIYIVSK
jgi:2-polyprenyl-3-methyl-5-hydroxy-6-metoxy-1,4-benzoquinol methylase